MRGGALPAAGRGRRPQRYDPAGTQTDGAHGAAAPATEQRMATSFPVPFDDGHVAVAVRVDADDDLRGAASALGLEHPAPVLVVVGGAGGLDPSDDHRLARLFAAGVVPVVEDVGAAAVDGGTHSGVMRLHGLARARAGATYPLVGVAATGTVSVPGCPPPGSDGADLDALHTHFVLVPGDAWGAEAPWIARVATVVAGVEPSVTVVINGGQIVLDDVARSIDAGRPVIAVAGTGRTADRLAAAVRGAPDDARVAQLAASGLIVVAQGTDPTGVSRLVADALSGSPIG